MIEAASPTLRRAYGRNKMNLNLAPNIGEIIVRSKTRIETLSLAMIKEGKKAKPNKQRILALSKERKTRQSELKLFIEG